MEKYFYLNSKNEQVGPVSPEEFTRFGINESSMVWKHGMDNWLPAGHIPELASYLEQRQQPIINQVTSATAQRQQQAFNVQQKPDNFMVWSILATIFCCFATGIAAIVESCRVDNYWHEGKYEESKQAMNDARKWGFISLGIGVVGYLSLVLFGPPGWLFFQLLLLTLWFTWTFVKGVGTGASQLGAMLLWIGGIAFLIWFVPILFNLCF